MKLSTRTRYGTRFMVHLAQYGAKTPVLLRDVAHREDISMKYLSQIVIPLKTHGLIGSVRGARGGYFLTRHPERITLKEILEALEDSLVLVDCTRESDLCARTSVCATRRLWKELTEHMKRYLETVSLQDLIQMTDQETEHPLYTI